MSEGTRAIYAPPLRRPPPAGPGKSHQSLRDVSPLAALPNVAIVHPGTPTAVREALRWAVLEAAENVAIRLAIGLSPRRIDLPSDWTLGARAGTVLADGADALLFAYGPAMLHEALLAAETLGGEWCLASGGRPSRG